MNQEVIVIFGASGGVGSALAKRMALQGKRAVLCSRNEQRLKMLSEETQHPFFVCDGTSEEEVYKTIGRIDSQEGRIDGVVNCIGSFFIKPLSLTSLQDWNEVFRINLTSCFSILKGALEKMTLQKQGSIVLISSCAAQIGLSHHEAIGAAKGAIEALIRSAAASNASKGVRINGVAPGLIDTPLSKEITKNEAALKASIGFHPLGRIGKADEIAAAIDWLLSSEASWITGQILSVDGGLSHLKTH